MILGSSVLGCTHNAVETFKAAGNITEGGFNSVAIGGGDHIDIFAGNGIFVRTQIFVDNIQPVVDGEGDEADAVDSRAGTDADTVEVNVVLAALKKLSGKEGHIGGAEGGLHIVDANVDDVFQVGNVAQIQHLSGKRHQKSLLCLNALKVASGISAVLDTLIPTALTETENAHSLSSVQVLIAFAQMNREALEVIFIMHIDGNVKINSAEGIDDLDDHIDIDNCIEVNIITEKVLYLLKKTFNTVLAGVDISGIDGVELLGSAAPADVNKGVTGDVNHINGVSLGVELADNDSVGAVAALVAAYYEEGINAVIALGGERLGVKLGGGRGGVELVLRGVGAVTGFGSFQILGRTGRFGLLGSGSGRCAGSNVGGSFPHRVADDSAENDNHHNCKNYECGTQTLAGKLFAGALRLGSGSLASRGVLGGAVLAVFVGTKDFHK